MQHKVFIATFGAFFLIVMALPVWAGENDFLLSVDEAVWQTRKSRAHLVDVRPPEEFTKVSIPGSLNIPLVFVKTKPYLKSKTIILVNAGFARSKLQAECRRLNKRGYQAYILAGGLLAWHEKGQVLRGDLTRLIAYTLLTPAVVYQEAEQSNFIFIDVSPENAAEKQVLPGVVFKIPFDFRQNVNLDLKQALGKAVKKVPTGRMIVCNRSGKGYAAIRGGVNGIDGKPVFYLEGGWQAYEHYTDHYARLYKSREERLERTFCNNCGPVEKPSGTDD